MPWNGLGQYVLPPAYSPEINGTIIDANRYNGLTSDVATGISNALAKDGQNVPTANISWGGFRLTNLAQAVATGDALGWGQNALVVNLITTGTSVFGGVLSAPLGAVGVPSHTFTGDLDNGMWSPGADILAWSTAGVERARFTAAGDYGVGGTPNAYGAGLRSLTLNATTQPVFDLNVNNTRTVTLNTSAVQATLSTQTAIPLLFGTNATEKARLTSAGDFGLGGTPNAYGAGFVALTVNGATQSIYDLNVGGTRTGNFSAIATAVVLASNTNVPLVFQQNSIERARFDTGNGNFLVGATTAGFNAANRHTVEVTGTNEALFGLRTGGGNSGYLFHDGTNISLNNNLVGSLTLGTNSVVGLTLTSDRRLYGSALHNNAGAVTGTTNQYVASGTYTPAATAVLNCTVPAGNKCQWLRVGNVVTVSGSCSLNVTTGGATSTEIDLSLPIASNLAATTDLGGSHLCNISITSGAARLDADTTNDRARLFFSSASTGAATLTFIFSYEIL